MKKKSQPKTAASPAKRVAKQSGKNAEMPAVAEHLESYIEDSNHPSHLRRGAVTIAEQNATGDAYFVPSWLILLHVCNIAAKGRKTARRMKKAGKPFDFPASFEVLPVGLEPTTYGLRVSRLVVFYQCYCN